MDTARRVVALLLLISLPPSLLLWIVIHPFAGFWRRLGAWWTYGLLAAPSGVIMLATWWARRSLLGRDFGTSWTLIALAILCAVVAGVLAFKRRGLLTFGVLSGLPELSPSRYPGRLLTEGIYSRIRHPRYVEVVVGTLAYALFANYAGSYVLWLLLCPTLLLIVRLEERELRERFGAAWTEYARQVPRFLPRWRKRVAPGA